MDPLQLALTNLGPDEADVEAADAPASSEAGPVGVTEAAVAGSMVPTTEAPEASAAASAPQLLPSVGDIFGDSCTWSTSAGGGGGAVEWASGASLDRGGCRCSACIPWSESLSLFEW